MPAKVLGGMLEMYWKPSTQQLIFRSPTSRQVSKAVKDQQANFGRRMAGENIAGACRGKKGRSFWACLRREGKDAYASKSVAT